MTEFHHPYQFIRVDTRKTKTDDWKTLDGLERVENRFIRHDYWHKEGLSGRITCTLKTLSPLVVGSEQKGGNKEKGIPGEVLPYRDRDGNSAIPGNSLRGMVGNIAETISQSSLRVLIQAENGEYSVRKPAQAEKVGIEDSPLKKIGLLCKQADGRFAIYPLADEDNKAIPVGDYQTKDNKETQFLRTHDCYQRHHNSQSHSYGSHAVGIYYIRGENKQLGKRREYYLPWDGKIDDSKLLTIKPNVVTVLETILRTLYATIKDSKDRETKSRQMLPKGYANQVRGWETKDDKPLVLDGDLLYYRETHGDVVEISYSSIWRKAIPGDLHGAFKKTAGINSLPWNADRDALTPAEALFGVVEDKPDEKKRGGARNLASRVRFTDAIVTQPIELQDTVILKILNSPKPPSPAMYFSGNGRYVAKTDLNLGTDTPNGRKQYLPHPRSLFELSGNDWETQRETRDKDYRPHMHLRCQPIPAQVDFRFYVHFENLNAAELGLLLTALQPAEAGSTFVHRLGLGKPLGLGHVQLDTQVETIDRCHRYSRIGLQAVRYQAWAGQLDTSLLDTKALKELRWLANSNNIPAHVPVCYPFDSNKGQEAYDEGEGFKWFGNNDSRKQRASHQALESVKPGKPLPTLTSTTIR
jgi:CRISPR-associated protein (TIGR03986 family)